MKKQIELKLNVKFDQLYNLVIQLPQTEKLKLFDALKESLKHKWNKSKERELGKYEGEIILSEDFNDELDDFQEYM